MDAQTPPRDETEQVRALWQGLGLPGIIDLHTHFLPQNVLDKVWAYFDAAGALMGRRWPITYRFAEERRVEILRGFGVTTFTSMVYPHKPDMAAWLNSWARDFAARTPDCLPTATFYPEPDAEAYVSDALDHGARIFKVHVQVGDFSPVDDLLAPVWSQLEEARTPVVIHCGSGPAPGRFTGPGPIGDLLRRHPRLRLVIAHLGMPEYAEFLDLAERYDDVHLDTTMAFTDFIRAEMPLADEDLPRLRDLGHKIVFGSDFPNIPYPYLHALESCVRLGLGEQWLRGVLHENAARIITER